MNYSKVDRNMFERVLLYILFIGLTLTTLTPFLWMLTTSFKEYREVFIYPPRLLPSHFTTEAYRKIFTFIPFARQFLNSVIVTSLVLIGQLICCSLAGYSFARLEFPGRDIIFLLYLGTLMIPGYVTLIPTYILVRFLGWINTLYALFVPGLFGGAFGTFLLRQFFLTIPKELEDAAKIDGCGYFRIYSTIMLPQITPALATLGVFTFMGSWNDFFWPLVVINSEDKKTITVGIATLTRGFHATDWTALMAGATLSVLPVIIVFLFAQKYFTEGIVLTGIKG
jgi:multiple sugar transport system permease protein